MVAGQAGAIVDFNDGGHHVIDYVINDRVYVDHPDLPSAGGTQIEIISGGWLKSGLEAYGTSRVTVNGGRIDSVLGVSVNSRLVMYSGFAETINAIANSETEIHGGEITEILTLGSQSSAIITDGTIGSIGTHVNRHLIMSGGTILEDIVASGNGLINLIGTDFQVNGHTVGYGDRASTWATAGIDPWGHPWLTGTVVGILESGDVINNGFTFYQNGDITFIPEPTTILLLVVGGLFLRKKN